MSSIRYTIGLVVCLLLAPFAAIVICASIAWAFFISSIRGVTRI